jgi:RNA polymerase sigma factor (TIGR02999 family)
MAGEGFAVQCHETDTEGVAQDFFVSVYKDLRRVAAHMIHRDGGAHTLQATALVHEAFLRFNRSKPQAWENQCHFFSAAAEAMRRILIEHARRNHTLRRGSGFRPVNLDGIQVAEDAPSDVLLAVDEALEKLALADPLKAELIKLRFFAGCTVTEVASLMNMGERTVKWHWAFARAWLIEEMTAGQKTGDPRLEI